MPLNVAGKQLANGALVVAGGPIVATGHKAAKRTTRSERPDG